jgi:hypothetical protein
MAIAHQGEQSLEAEKDNQAVTIDDRRREDARELNVAGSLLEFKGLLKRDRVLNVDSIYLIGAAVMILLSGLTASELCCDQRVCERWPAHRKSHQRHCPAKRFWPVPG